MKTLIFEGIVTSGKSTITGYLLNALRDEMRVELATEEQTHTPIMEQRSKLHTEFFEDLISQLTTKCPDLVVFDRLYISQAHRARADLDVYSSVEDALLPYSPHTIVLKINEDTIADRIKAASEHRDQKWVEYLKTKGNNFDEIAEGYIQQQRGVLRLIGQSKIPYTIFNTTDHDYEEITDDILKLVRN